LLTRLESRDVFARRALEVHRKPDGPDDYSRDAGGDVLGNLEALFICKLFDFDVVGLDLSLDHCAVRVSILRLHRGDRLRVAARAADKRDAKHRDTKHATHSNPPLPGRIIGQPSRECNTPSPPPTEATAIARSTGPPMAKTRAILRRPAKAVARACRHLDFHGLTGPSGA
jgi:hypothetical protein